MRPAWLVLAALLGCGDSTAGGTGLGLETTTTGATTHATVTEATPTDASTTTTTIASGSSDDTSTGETTSTGTDAGLPGAVCRSEEMRSCFEGPVGSEAIPPCQSGMQVCQFDGQWGPCNGDLLPHQQDCATPLDEACGSEPPICNGAPVWLRAFSLLPGDVDSAIGASALALADDGDIIATGTYQGVIDFAGEQIASAGDADIWVARFSPEGDPKWFRRFGGPETADVHFAGAPWSTSNLVTLPGSDIVVSTTCMHTTDFGFGPLAGEEGDAAVLRMTAAGQVKWARRFVGLGDSSGNSFPLRVAPGKNGKLWLAGTLYGKSVDLGGGPLHSAGWGDVLLAQLDADGDHLWSRRHGNGGHQDVGGAAATPDGGLVIIGDLEGSLDLGDGPLVSNGSSDAYVARLDATGALLWARHDGDNYEQYGDHVSVGPDGTIVIAGSFLASIDLGGETLISPVNDNTSLDNSSQASIFLAQLSPAGDHVWSRMLANVDSDPWVSWLNRAADGGLVLTGSGQLGPLFPGNVWGTGEHAWIATLAADVTPQWLQSVEYTHRAVAGPKGSVIAVFNVDGEASFAGLMVGAPNAASLVIAKFGP